MPGWLAVGLLPGESDGRGEFRQIAARGETGKNDKEWFPRWIRRYASSVKVVDGNCRSARRRSSVPAVAAEEQDPGVAAVAGGAGHRGVPQSGAADRGSVLGVHPSEAEPPGGPGAGSGAGSGRPGVQDERHLIGRIDPNEPAIIQQMRKEMRVRHKALETERAYVGWVQRFIQHCGSPELADFGEGEIKTFLTDLAVEGNVTAGTQKQAKCALLFLYQTVLGRELGFLDVGRATKPERLPVVLSRQEIVQAAAGIQGPAAVDVPGHVRRGAAASGVPPAAGQGRLLRRRAYRRTFGQRGPGPDHGVARALPRGAARAN